MLSVQWHVFFICLQIRGTPWYQRGCFFSCRYFQKFKMHSKFRTWKSTSGLEVGVKWQNNRHLLLVGHGMAMVGNPHSFGVRVWVSFMVLGFLFELRINISPNQVWTRNARSSHSYIRPCEQIQDQAESNIFAEYCILLINVA